MPRNRSASKIFRGSRSVEISIIEIFLLSEQGQQKWRSKEIKAMKRQNSEERSLSPLDQISWSCPDEMS